MEIAFLDPNLAYLFLVSFFFLAGIAILSPGTGLLEVGALVTLVAAGWGVYTLPINIWALVVLILGVFPFMIAVRRSQKTLYLIISVASLVIGSSFLFKSGVWWKPAVHPVLALVVSVIVGGFFWIIAMRTIEAELAPPSHNLGRLIGVRGEARSYLDQEVEGSVQVLGELWSARATEPIQEGEPILVVDRMGLVLEVSPIKEDL
jgi:membrane-bound serine protease (ClpP class)